MSPSGAVDGLSHTLLRGLRRGVDRLLDKLDLDPEWTEAARAADRRGNLVYVLRHASIADYLALDHLTRRLGLTPIGFVNELPPRIAPQGSAPPAAALRKALANRRAAALFVKRRPETTMGRGRREGSALLETLMQLQRDDMDRPIVLLPQIFVWSARPEQRRFSLVDTLFGPAEFPGELRMAAQLLLDNQGCRLRAGEPLELRDFLAEQRGSNEALARRLTYALLRKVERERRIVVGPAHKPPDRVREDVLRSPKLRAIIDELAGPGGNERALLTEKARGMLREMQTVPDVETQRSLALLAEQILDRVYADITIDGEGLARLRQQRAEGSVVLLPSHKSHVDYIVLSYVLRENGIQLPVIAAGDNLAFFPAGPLLRRCGAFFIRRSFRGDRLYAAVLDAYVRRLLRDGWMLELFLEGGRSRTGKLLPPKLGLLNMIVASALGLRNRKLFFVPVSIGYERLMEEGAFAREVSGEQKEKEDATQLLLAGNVLRDRWGQINIQFGEAVEMTALLAELGIDPDTAERPAKRRTIVKQLAHRIMNEIHRVTAATGGAVLALVLLSHERPGIAYRELIEQCRRVTLLLTRLGARTTGSFAGEEGLSEGAIRETLAMYVKSGLVEQHVPGDTLTAEGKRRARLYAGSDLILRVPSERRVRLDLAKNHIIGWLADRALLSVALLSADAKLEVDVLADRVQALSRLFKLEFMFRADASFDDIFADVLADMHQQGELALKSGWVTPGAGHDNLDGRGWLGFYAASVRNFLEGYRVAARSLVVLAKGPQSASDLSARALKLGERMYLAGEIERSEAVNRPVIENALEAFVDQGYLVRRDGGLALSDSFNSPEAAATIEGRIAAFLAQRGAL